MENFWNTLAGLGGAWITGESQSDIARANAAAARADAAAARSGQTNWTMIAIIGGAVVGLIALIFVFRK